jgi:hypothetical protein
MYQLFWLGSKQITNVNKKYTRSSNQSKNMHDAAWRTHEMSDRLADLIYSSAMTQGGTRCIHKRIIHAVDGFNVPRNWTLDVPKWYATATSNVVTKMTSLNGSKPRTRTERTRVRVSVVLVLVPLHRFTAGWRWCRHHPIEFQSTQFPPLAPP